MVVQHFQVGDRVKLCFAVGLVSKGALGTVQRLVPPLDAYVVHFDGYVVARFVWEQELDHAIDKPLLERTA